MSTISSRPLRCLKSGALVLALTLPGLTAIPAQTLTEGVLATGIEEPLTAALPQWTLIWEAEAPDSTVSYFGLALATSGDINGDGKMDIIVGAPGSGGGGQVFILSGTDGSVLRRYYGHNVVRSARFGESVAPAGDFDGDSTYDILVGAMSSACGECETGYAQVLSGAEGCPGSGPGCILATVTGSTPYEMFASSVSPVGDINGDGRTEILVGAPGVGNGYPGAARLFSSFDGAVLFEADGSSGDNLGAAVAATGDVNGDYVPDFLVGAPNADPGGISNAGRAVLYSGKTLRPIRTWKGTAISLGVGRSVAGAGRVNPDKFADVIIGVSAASPGGVRHAGRAKVYSGRDNTIIAKAVGTIEGAWLGWCVAAAGDLNGDLKGDILVGSPGINSSGGRVQAISGANGAVLFTYDGDPGDAVGWAMAIADVKGDLKPEIVVSGYNASASGGGRGYVKVFGRAP